MTVEEITQTLQTVAENQARHDEMHARHSTDIAEIDRMIAASLESHNRYDRQLARIFEVMSGLSDKQLKNEELFAENEKRFAELAEAQKRLEGSYELLESFVTEFRNETRDYFVETDRKLAALAGIQAATSDLLAEFVKETNGGFAEADKRQARTEEQIKALIAEADKRQARTEEQIKALIGAQARTDEQIRFLLGRDGSAKKKSGSKKPRAKRGAK